MRDAMCSFCYQVFALEIYILASHEGCYQSWEFTASMHYEFISSHPMRDAICSILPDFLRSSNLYPRIP